MSPTHSTATVRSPVPFPHAPPSYTVISPAQISIVSPTVSASSPALIPPFHPTGLISSSTPMSYELYSPDSYGSFLMKVLLLAISNSEKISKNRARKWKSEILNDTLVKNSPLLRKYPQRTKTLLMNLKLKSLNKKKICIKPQTLQKGKKTNNLSWNSRQRL